MAFDPGLHALMQGELAGHPVVEKRMFGGICFMLHGHMVGGIHKGGAMFRVGRAAEAQARAIPGTHALDFTGRPMTGMVGADADLMADDARRAALTRMALDQALSLPPKLPGDGRRG